MCKRISPQLFLPMEHRSYNRVLKISSTILIPPTPTPDFHPGFHFEVFRQPRFTQETPIHFFQAHIFAFLTPKMASLTPKTWEKSPYNKEKGPNFTYPVSRGLETGLVGPKAPHLILHIKKNIFTTVFLDLSKKTKTLFHRS